MYRHSWGGSNAPPLHLKSARAYVSRRLEAGTYGRDLTRQEGNQVMIALW
jgi:hypothetical protein